VHRASELPALLPRLAAEQAWMTYDPTCAFMGAGTEMAALRAQFPAPATVLEDRFQFFPVR
jgi:hypothetical protein